MIAVMPGMLAHHRDTYKGGGSGAGAASVVRALGREVCAGRQQCSLKSRLESHCGKSLEWEGERWDLNPRPLEPQLISLASKPEANQAVRANVHPPCGWIVADHVNRLGSGALRHALLLHQQFDSD